VTRPAHEIIREARQQVIKVLDGKIKEAEETASDILDDAAAELGYVDVDDDGERERNYEAYLGLESEVIEEAHHQLGITLMGATVWVLVSFHPDSGMQVEIFGERPHTADGDRNNWPKWFRLYEGNINGGDSILVDARGETI
jgi:hypothetical protein